MRIDTMEKCSVCGSGICLARSKQQGKPNFCLTTRQNREAEKVCPTCNSNVPESAIQLEKKRLRS